MSGIATLPTGRLNAWNKPYADLVAVVPPEIHVWDHGAYTMELMLANQKASGGLAFGARFNDITQVGNKAPVSAVQLPYGVLLVSVSPYGGFVVGMVANMTGTNMPITFSLCMKNRTCLFPAATEAAAVGLLMAPRGTNHDTGLTDRTDLTWLPLLGLPVSLNPAPAPAPYQDRVVGPTIEQAVEARRRPGRSPKSAA